MSTSFNIYLPAFHVSAINDTSFTLEHVDVAIVALQSFSRLGFNLINIFFRFFPFYEETSLQIKLKIVALQFNSSYQ